MLVPVFGLAFLYFYINPSEVNFLPKCILYSTTGAYCPGCGSQRAAHHLLNLDFYKAAQQNILFIVGLFALLYYCFIEISNTFFNKHYTNKLKQQKTLVIILIVIILFFILRNLPFEPFNWLAPH
ncbi:Protein of unknown function [Lutibacter oricola]|uniref:DUF2752 domain-containing protein n=2 Tax=Lutibacter oricola TaxID=762486 RepID=A0A1H2WCS9_9FLAO|nr:Protein of unknown function [Lutibacter oricola]